MLEKIKALLKKVPWHKPSTYMVILYTVALVSGTMAYIINTDVVQIFGILKVTLPEGFRVVAAYLSGLSVAVGNLLMWGINFFGDKNKNGRWDGLDKAQEELNLPSIDDIPSDEE